MEREAVRKHDATSTTKTSDGKKRRRRCTTGDPGWSCGCKGACGLLGEDLESLMLDVMR